ncbi:MAG: hypothetical protein JJT99_03585 [Rhodobacteraceae bacterium]|nr:hypothetical protein [Paracoccaceae bacterium]
MTQLSDIREMWKIQEDLLQQYRGMAITMLGLIAAALMVLISLFVSSWTRVEGVILRLFSPGMPELSDAFILVTFIIYAVLLFLGWQGNVRFKGICATRAKHVTFFQNLHIAEEAGKLQDICAAANTPYPIMHITLLRHIDGLKTPLSFEAPFKKKDMQKFHDIILQTGQKTEDDRIRHDRTRGFLKSWIFTVYNVFFSLATIQLLISVIHAATG